MGADGVCRRFGWANFGQSVGARFYAQKDIKTPVRIGIITLAATQLLNLLLIMPMQHAGLAFGNQPWRVSQCVLLLLRQLLKRNMYRPQQGWLGFYRKIGSALAVMAAVLLGLQAVLP